MLLLSVSHLNSCKKVFFDLRFDQSELNPIAKGMQSKPGLCYMFIDISPQLVLQFVSEMNRLESFGNIV